MLENLSYLKQSSFLLIVDSYFFVFLHTDIIIENS